MTLRVMWLLNHTSARKFEIPMLKQCGVSQIYLPKILPNDISFRSSSISYEEDQYLDIPADELEILNACDWYSGATPEAWALASKYFDVAFVILHDDALFREISRYFSGLVLYRAYGLDKTLTYSDLIRHFGLETHIRNMYSRFYFAEAYPHLADIEERYISHRRLYLPLGMAARNAAPWLGSDRKIYFVCPSIGFNQYYKDIYESFRRDFAEFDYVIAGEQLIPVNDPKVLGYVSNEAHTANMTQSRVMFYHSQEPNHIHYHPFEAILAGMPLVYMAGGMLDRMGGKGLPGRAASIEDARRIIRRLMKGDKALIESIRTTQKILLKSMNAEVLSPAWKLGIERLEADYQAHKKAAIQRPKDRVKRIAVILPEPYRGGTLRGAIMLAQAIHMGSLQCEDAIEVIFAHREDTDVYEDDDFIELGKKIARRPFRWQKLSSTEACRAMHFAGHEGWFTEVPHSVPDDGMIQFTDCDLWIFVSDRLPTALLPVRPRVMMIYDYLQRYENVMSRSTDINFVQGARSADKIFVTTEFTKNDALQYAGVDPRRLVQVPMLIPKFSHKDLPKSEVVEPYFLWTTNAAPHKNHLEVMKALRIYYEEYQGSLICRVTGVGTSTIPESKLSHLKPVGALIRNSNLLKSKIRWLGDLPDREYRVQLKSAQFLMHAARVDNGTFSVIEAAQLGVPSLSTNYPAMREMNEWFSLNLSFMDGSSARNMAKMLKQMEESCQALRAFLPSPDIFEREGVSTHARKYWQEVKSCL